MEYKLIISGTIGSWSASCSVDYVRYVLNNNKGKDVHVGFCSLGGYVKDGLEMNQAFKDHGQVYAHAFGMNASISTIAMLGCKSIDIVKGSFFLIHNVSTVIATYDQKNKEQLDNYIKDLQLQRDSLKTFDEVLASMYADKTGKSIDDCIAQMKKGNWLTAKQAKDFGLVDEIREDKESEKAAADFTNQFVNSYSNLFTEVGIPPLPSNADDSKTPDNNVFDEEGNPTQSFLQKTWQALQNLLHNQQVDNSKNNMIKIFASVMALLACSDGFKPLDDGTIALTQEQMKKIDDQLASQTKTLNENVSAMKASADAINKLKKEKADLEKDLKEKNEQIANLNGAPGATEDNKPLEEGAEAFTAQDLFNCIKDA